MDDRWVVWFNRGLMVLTALLMLCAIITLITVIVSYNGGKMELGSLADWFSGLCNAVMAAAAVYAAYNAKDWLITKRRNEAYEYATSIIDTVKEIDHIHSEIQLKFIMPCFNNANEFSIYDVNKLNISLLAKVVELTNSFNYLKKYQIEIKNADYFDHAVRIFNQSGNTVGGVLKNYAVLSNDMDAMLESITSCQDDIMKIRNNILNQPIDELFKFN